MGTNLRRTFRGGWSVVAVSVALTAVACGGGSTESDSAEGEPSTPPSSTAAAGLTAMGAGADACARLTVADITAAVGNPVLPGKPEAGTNTCNFDAENPEDVDVLLIVNPPGSIREQVLCPELRKAETIGERVPGVGDVAVWKFSSLSLFNSGDLEACGSAGFVSLSLNGRRDEAALKNAATTLARKIFQ